LATAREKLIALADLLETTLQAHHPNYIVDRRPTDKDLYAMTRAEAVDLMGEERKYCQVYASGVPEDYGAGNTIDAGSPGIAMPIVFNVDIYSLYVDTDLPADSSYFKWLDYLESDSSTTPGVLHKLRTMHVLSVTTATGTQNVRIWTITGATLDSLIDLDNEGRELAHICNFLITLE